MGTILGVDRQMAEQSYSGDLSPAEAWALLQRESDAVLVDVRTRPEWQFVGVPDLGQAGKQAALLSWQDYPTMAPNAGFLVGLEKHVAKDAAVLFICRSGARSRAAAIAATRAGWSRAYNVADGFEGPVDADRHRGGAGGWKASGLPWIQE